jgi:hypothetical protein
MLEKMLAGSSIENHRPAIVSWLARAQPEAVIFPVAAPLPARGSTLTKMPEVSGAVAVPVR